MSDLSGLSGAHIWSDFFTEGENKSQESSAREGGDQIWSKTALTVCSLALFLTGIRFQTSGLTYPLRIGPRVSYTLGKCFTTELQLQPFSLYFETGLTK